MIGGILMILIAVWIYQSVSKVKKPNGLFWVAGCAALFFAVQWLLVQLNIIIIDTYQGDDIGGNYDRDLTSIGDRMTNEQGTGGTFMNVVFELLPPFGAFLVVALIRTKFIMQEAITVANLFSGIKEMFISIKNSFKSTAEDKE
ncbi:hypothetical protein [methane-oxidizing endosymbiont of Gigantopelta aegis]|uniref:hypothetical protein n=1 Tax=methane-oxidizing endosymbiont of Gigantopelta aegis TaxID=2794938 RepID=UPI0018DBA78D|nr:hypothetical protein [methane-oxidizing endosymbiont of Gigantopelta aegis]